MDKKVIASSLNVALRLLLICLCAALLLGGVHLLTAPRIAAQEQAKIDAAIRTLFPAAGQTEVLSGDFVKEIVSVRRAEADGVLLGYCVQALGSGYGSDLSLMISYNTKGELLQIAVLSHSETKGIGTKVVENADYLALYAGTSGTDVSVDGVSGATLSSNGVRALVLAANTAVLEVIGA